MLNYETAEMILRDTMNSAFSKNAATAKKRVAFAVACVGRIPLNSADNVRLLVWATDFAKKWKATKVAH